MYTVSMPAKNSPNHGFAKRAGFHSCRLFLLCIFFGLKPTCTISPQCLHFISSTTFPGGISSMSKMRRPHLGFGHFTFSIDHRLPTLIWNKGTSLFLPVPFYPLCFIGFLPFWKSTTPKTLRTFYRTSIPALQNPGSLPGSADSPAYV